MPPLLDLTTHFFLQMAAVLVAYRLLWPLFERLGQVHVVANMAAGFLLGPSVLGALSPGPQQWLFPTTIEIGGQEVTHPSLSILYVVGQLGLVLYMFLVGSSFRTEIFTAHLRVAGATATAGVAVPMMLGGATGLVLASVGGYFSAGVEPWQAAMFLAAAVAVTAFPILAWIIHAAGLHNTRLGTMSLACAAADDACAWVLLAAVVASTGDDMGDAVLAFVGGVGFTLFMFVVGRRLLRPLDRWAQREMRDGRDETLPVGPLVAVLVVVMMCAWFTDLVGVYSVFGAFVAGVVMPRGRMLDAVRSRVEPLVAYLLLPAFFIFAGLNTELSLLFEPSVLLVAVVVLAVAVGGKFGAVTLTARYQGMSWREAGSMGALANARGMTELILLNIGLAAGIITPALYTILALMAFITTFTATPLFRLFERGARKNGLVFDADGETPVPGSQIPSQGHPRSGSSVL